MNPISKAKFVEVVDSHVRLGLPFDATYAPAVAPPLPLKLYQLKYSLIYEMFTSRLDPPIFWLPISP